MEYEIIFETRVIKQDLKFIEKTAKKRIVKEIRNKLKSNPFEFGKPLRFELKKLFSLRVGDYRVIFHLNEGEQSVMILKIGHRKDVYEEALKRL
jgi:mRNA interferase RelE/StbE